MMYYTRKTFEAFVQYSYYNQFNYERMNISKTVTYLQCTHRCIFACTFIYAHVAQYMTSNSFIQAGKVIVLARVYANLNPRISSGLTCIN